MSIALMTQAWKSDLPAMQKMVLLALCDNANDQGECYPSIQMLAKKCSLSDRAIQKQINELEAAGIISREMRNGRSTVYWINPRRLFTPEDCSPPNVVHHTPERGSPPPPNVVHHPPERGSPITINEPSIESSVNQKNRKKGGAAGFDPRVYLLSLGVGEDVASDWLALRNRRKSDPSKTAIDGVAREAVAAGLSLSDALAECCVRGWIGFKAAWLASGSSAAVAPAARSAGKVFDPLAYNNRHRIAKGGV